MIHGYTLLVPVNQGVLNKLSKECNISGQMRSTTHTECSSLKYALFSLLRTLLVPWYQQCATVYHVPKCMSCHKAIVVITLRVHCFHSYIYVYVHLAFVGFDHTVCRRSFMNTQRVLVSQAPLA